MTGNGGNGAGITRLTRFEELPELLSVDEFAAFTGVGRGTIYELVRTQKITHYRKFGRVIRISREECRSAVR
jgi:excisionase family DNA binding protein